MAMKALELHPEAEKFKEYLAYDCAASTAYNYSRDVSKFLVWVDKPLEELKPQDITNWYKSLEGTYAPRTVWRFGWALRRFFDVMDMQELKRRTPIMKYEVPDVLWLPKDKTMELIQRVPELCVGYDLALRIGEVGLLRRSGFNQDTGAIEVTRLKHKGRRNTYILGLDEWALDVLNEYLEEDLGDVMFPLSVSTYQDRFNVRAAALGLEGYSYHCLRHSRVTHIALAELEEKGVVDELSLSKFAGHLKVETTRMYVHLATRHLAFKT